MVYLTGLKMLLSMILQRRIRVLDHAGRCN
jgi:hypothetical protein